MFIRFTPRLPTVGVPEERRELSRLLFSISRRGRRRGNSHRVRSLLFDGMGGPAAGHQSVIWWNVRMQSRRTGRTSMGTEALWATHSDSSSSPRTGMKLSAREFWHRAPWRSADSPGSSALFGHVLWIQLMTREEGCCDVVILRKLVLCLGMAVAAVVGAPMRPDEIEDLLRNSQKARIELSIREDREESDDWPYEGGGE